MTINIYNWNDLSAHPWDSLIIGNGGSIALHSGFAYSSLYDVAIMAGNLNTAARIFTSLRTADFEHVLLACWYANIVNSAIGMPAPLITSAYDEVRDALIAAVQQTHCIPSAITSDLQKIGVFASRFSTVLTFNYDLTLYWAMLDFNAKNGNWFKDGFISGQFDPYWNKMRSPYKAVGTTMVFYAHGSLMLARDIHGVEIKLAATGVAAAGHQTALLNAVINAWSYSSHMPIFVSEGTAVEKLQSIQRSPYLTAVYNQVLSQIGNGVVVYGFSFSQNDLHVIEALKRNPPECIAISVFGGLSATQRQSYCHNVTAILAPNLPYTKLFFFDSQSTNCWNN